MVTCSWLLGVNVYVLFGTVILVIRCQCVRAVWYSDSGY